MVYALNNRDYVDKVAKLRKRLDTEIETDRGLKAKWDGLVNAKLLENLLRPGEKSYRIVEPSKSADIFRDVYDPIAEVIKELSLIQNNSDAYKVIDSIAKTHNINSVVKDIQAIKKFIIENGYRSLLDSKDVNMVADMLNGIIDSYSEVAEKSRIETEDKAKLAPVEKHRAMAEYFDYLSDLSDDDLLNISLAEGFKGHFIDRNGRSKVISQQKETDRNGTEYVLPQILSSNGQPTREASYEDLIDYLFYKKYKTPTIFRSYNTKSKHLETGEEEKYPIGEEYAVPPEEGQEEPEPETLLEGKKLNPVINDIYKYYVDEISKKEIFSTYGKKNVEMAIYRIVHKESDRLGLGKDGKRTLATTMGIAGGIRNYVELMEAQLARDLLM